MLHNILLFCEVFIAMFGIFAIIIADNTHERLHGLFVVGLALEGFLSHALDEGSPITATVLIVLTVIALLMIIMSFHSLIEHLRRYYHRLKHPHEVPKNPSLTINSDVDYASIHALIESNFAKLESILIDREKALNEREKALNEREERLNNMKKAEVATTDDENK